MKKKFYSTCNNVSEERFWTYPSQVSNNVGEEKCFLYKFMVPWTDMDGSDEDGYEESQHIWGFGL